MQAGRLDRRIELQHRVLGSRSASGQQAVTYETYATVWAGKKDLRGREYYAANQMNAEISTQFRLRWRSDVLATDRIVCEGVSYNIRPPIAEIGRREGLEILATATVS